MLAEAGLAQVLAQATTVGAAAGDQLRQRPVGIGISPYNP